MGEPLLGDRAEQAARVRDLDPVGEHVHMHGRAERVRGVVAVASRSTSCGYIGGCDGCAPELASLVPDVHVISEVTASSIMTGIGPVMVSEATSCALPVNTSAREVPG